MDLITVIVPVYMAEKYLDRCIFSICHQTYKNIELILVDDGSTDQSPYICECWAKKDSRVRVIHQKNQGVSVARNKGIIQALEEKLGAKLYICDEAQLCGALGAALFAYEKCTAAR